MSETPVREVSRDVIVKAAKKAIARARQDEAIISTPLARKLMKVARAHDRFLLGAWYRASCGCLVGNLHGPTTDGDGLSTAEYSVGVYFDEALRDLKFGAPFTPQVTILEVTS